jgi:hypothetical protein
MLIIAAWVAEDLRAQERVVTQPRISDRELAARAVFFDDDDPALPDCRRPLTREERQLTSGLAENILGRVDPRRPAEDQVLVRGRRNAADRPGPLTDGDDPLADLVGQRRALIAADGGRLLTCRTVRPYRVLSVVLARVATKASRHFGMKVSTRMVRTCWTLLGPVVAPGRRRGGGQRDQNSGQMSRGRKAVL